MADVIGQAVVELGVKDNLSKALDNVEKKEQDVGKAGKKMGDDLKSGGSVGASGISKIGDVLKGIGGQFALAELAVSALKGALNGLKQTFTEASMNAEAYTSKLNQAGANVNATAEEMKQLDAIAKKTGDTLGVSYTEAAEAIYQYVGGEIDVQDAINGTAEIVKFAKANMLDMGSAAILASQAVMQFGYSSEDTGAAMDVITEGMKMAFGTAEDMANALQEAGPKMGTFGASLEDTIAILTGLGNAAGIVGSEAGNALKNGFSRIASGAKATKEAIEGMGLSFDDMRGKLDQGDVIGVLEDLEKGLAGVSSNSDKSAILSKIFGEAAGPAMSALLAGGTESLREYSEQLQNAGGATDDMYERLVASQSPLTRLQTMWQNMTTTRGQIINPALNEWLDEIGGLLEGLGYIVTIVLKALSWLSSVVKEIVDFAIRPFAQALGLAGEKGGLFSGRVDKMKSNLLALENIFHPLIEVVQKLRDVFKQGFSTVVDFVLIPIKSILGNIFTYIKSRVSGVAEFFKALVSLLKGDFDGFKEHRINGFNKIIGGFITMVKNILLNLGNFVTTAIKVVRELNKGILKVIAGLFVDLGVMLANSLKSIFTGIGDFLSNVVNSIKNIDWGAAWQGALDAVGEWISKSWQKIKDWAKNVWKKIKNALSGTEDTIEVDATVGKLTTKGEENAIKELQFDLKQTDGMFTNTKAAWNSTMSNISSAIDGFKAINEVINGGAEDLKDEGEAGSEAFDEIAEGIEGANEEGSDLNKTLGDTKKKSGSAKDSSKDFTDSFKSNTKNLTKEVENLSTALKKFSNLMTETMNDMQDSIRKTQNSIQGLIDDMNDALEKAGYDFAEDLIGDKAKYQKELDKLEGELEGIKLYGKGEDGSVSDYEVAEARKLIDKYLDEEDEKKKAILKAELDSRVNAEWINENTKDYINKLEEALEKKKQIKEIDDALARNLDAGSGIDLDDMLASAKLEGTKKREQEYKDEIGKITEEANQKIKAEEEVLKVQMVMLDALQKKRFLNEEEFQKFREMILGSENISEDAKQEAVKLAEKLKKLNEEKESVEKVQEEILKIRADVEKQMEELEDQKNAKVKEGLAEELAQVDSVLKGYEQLAQAKNLAFTPVQTKKEEKGGEDEGATDDEQTQKSIDNSNARMAQMDAETLKNEETQKKQLTDRVNTNKSITESSTQMTNQIVANINREISRVDSLISYYHRLAAAKASAGYYNGGYTGFAKGGYTGTGGLHDIAGVVHKGEYVIPNKVLRKLGPTGIMPILEKMRKGFEDGGFTSGNPVITQDSSMSVTQNIYNSIDAEESLQMLNILYNKYR